MIDFMMEPRQSLHQDWYDSFDWLYFLPNDLANVLSSNVIS